MEIRTNNADKKYLFISYSKNQPLLLNKIKNSIYNTIKESNKKVSAHISSKNKSFIINNDLINTIDTDIKSFTLYPLNIWGVTSHIWYKTPHIAGLSVEFTYFQNNYVYSDLHITHNYMYLKTPSNISSSSHKRKRFISGGSRWE